MHDRDYCDKTAVWAAEVARDHFAHLPRGAVAYPAFGPRAILFFGNEGSREPIARHPVVTKLREYFAIEEVGIRELGLGATTDQHSWALLVESHRDADYCRRLIEKAYRESRATENQSTEASRS